MVDFSIIMAYFNRKHQLSNTLSQFDKMYSCCYQFEVIVVDDASDLEHQIQDLPPKFRFPLQVHVITKKQKGRRINPCVAYNIGIRLSKGKCIVLQNPECFHMTNILEHCVKNLKLNDYFAFSCYAANNTEISESLMRQGDISAAMHEKNKKTKPCHDWYNHPTLRPTGYHFCSAMHRSLLSEIGGGFDERFAKGYGFDDDYFLWMMKKHAKVTLIPPEEGYVLHQYHLTDKNMLENKKLFSKWRKNQLLFKKLTKEHPSPHHQHSS